MIYEKIKFLLKSFWNWKNLVELRQRERREFKTDPSKQLAIIRIRDKFEANGNIHSFHMQRSSNQQDKKKKKKRKKSWKLNPKLQRISVEWIFSSDQKCSGETMKFQITINFRIILNMEFMHEPYNLWAQAIVLFSLEPLLEYHFNMALGFNQLHTNVLLLLFVLI